ncbi:MAG: sugar phosphate isomerase/epimerase, partial [Paracoccaceae bacterium]|nr:sugar phosphate isomerase/epimerase [Paracoccaceae bacterium]
MLKSGLHERVGLMAALPGQEARRLIARIDGVPLFAHAYSHHLNLRFGTATPLDLLTFASHHGLVGLKIHVEDGEALSLLRLGTADRRRFGAMAVDLGLQVHIETSSTERQAIAATVAIASDVSATSIRCYPRYAGRVSQIVERVIDDLKALADIDYQRRFLFTLEQHEDLKSYELVKIVRAVGNPRLSLMYDFGNMINAGERPMDALTVMAPLVTDVHVKDVKILPDRGGWAHEACRSGDGNIDFQETLRHLLLLGTDQPQVTAFGLEEENGMYAPAYRFPDEADDPCIPPRSPSETPLPEGVDLKQRLAQER